MCARVCYTAYSEVVKMKDKVFTVAIIGCGSRGCDAYGSLMRGMPDKYKVTAMCDINPAKLDKYAPVFGIAQENRFDTEEAFFAAKRAEVLVIATPDACHIRQGIKGLELGYDVLVEKPLSASEKECADLLAAQKKYGGKVMVCHVLRYAKGFTRVAELIENGVIGELVSIQALEQVTYWHQAHSYVRGNWRRSEDTTPMILAKCCHDLDLLQYYARSKCASVSSTGDLKFFNRAHQPQGAADRCMQCKYIESCPYSAKRLYIDNWKNAGKPENCWPYNVITLKVPLTEDGLAEAVQNGPYGRCVFACDNNVVDHQIVQMQFNNGVNASLTMTAFTANGGRIMRFFGTQGEIVLNEEEDAIHVKPFGKPAETTRISAATEGGHAHGGGDFGLITALYKTLTGEQTAATSLEASIESHLMGIAAEKSRRSGGACVQVHA